MKSKQLPEYVKIKSKKVDVEKISEYHFGRMFFEMFKSVFMKHFICSENHFFTITSGGEPWAITKHVSKNSAHYDHIAIDIRIRAFSPLKIQYIKTYTVEWWQLMQQAVIQLSIAMPEYYFVLEKDHLHIQVSNKNIKSEPITPILPNCIISKSIKPDQ